MSYELITTNYGKSALVTKEQSEEIGYDKDTMDMLAHHGILGMKWGVRRYQPYGHGGYDPEHKGRNVGEASKVLASIRAAGENVGDAVRKKRKQQAEKKAKDDAVREQNRLAEEEWKRQEYLKKQERKREDKSDRAEFKNQQKIQKREEAQERKADKEEFKNQQKIQKREAKQAMKEEQAAAKIEEKARKEHDQRIAKLTTDVLNGKKINTRNLSDDDLRAISSRVNAENTMRQYADTAAKNAAADAEAGKSWIRKNAEKAATDLGNKAIEAGKQWIINKATDYAMQISDPSGYALKKELAGLKKKTDEMTIRNNYQTAFNNQQTNFINAQKNQNSLKDLRKQMEVDSMTLDNKWYTQEALRRQKTNDYYDYLNNSFQAGQPSIYLEDKKKKKKS